MSRAASPAVVVSIHVAACMVADRANDLQRIALLHPGGAPLFLSIPYDPERDLYIPQGLYCSADPEALEALRGLSWVASAATAPDGLEVVSAALRSLESQWQELREVGAMIEGAT